MKKESEHKLLLKIPVFISEVDDYNNGMSFWTFTLNDIIAYLKEKIRLYGLQEPYSYQKKDKSEEVTIESIKPEDILFDETLHYYFVYRQGELIYAVDSLSMKTNLQALLLLNTLILYP